MKFTDLNLSEDIQSAVVAAGFEKPSPIQELTIPLALEGKDVIGQAQTGTGKTAAFGLPTLDKIRTEENTIQALVIAPTRELAVQSQEELFRFGRDKGVKVRSVYGGSSIEKQIKALRSGAHIVVGTPGRLLDLIKRKALKLNNIETLILDEADEMLNMGFLEDIEAIISRVPEERQTLLFSATMPDAIKRIGVQFMKDPEHVKIKAKELTNVNVDQYFIRVKEQEKFDTMTRLMDVDQPELSIVFGRTKRRVDELTRGLKLRGFRAEGIHGDLDQNKRLRVIRDFKNDQIDILVATDVAARGLDISGVTHVYNYDIPQDPESYVHRIGRTGRAGREGKAFSLVVGKEVYKLRDIQRYCKTKIIPQAIPSLNDITEIKADKILDQVQDILNDTDLTKIVNIIEKKLMEDDYTSLDLAAALLKMSMGDDNEDIIDNYMPARSLDDLDSYGRNSRGRDRGRNNSRRKGATDRAAVDYVLNGGEERMARLFINIGKSQRVTPGDILGAVAGESGIPGRLVGSIDMYDGYTFVDVPAEYAEDVLNAMSHARIKGKHIHVEKANSKR